MSRANMTERRQTQAATRRFAQVEQQKDRIELKCCRYIELNLLSLKKLIQVGNVNLNPYLYYAI